MSLIAVTQLSDGRLQLWAINGPTFVTATQNAPTSNSMWTVSPVSPSPISGTEQAVGVAAGHSPNGRAQLWVSVFDSVKVSQSLLTTWEITKNPASGWEPWESFPASGKGPGDFLDIKAVGQLSDGRMQLFAIGGGSEDLGYLWSNWKTTTETNSSWTGWRRFDPQPAVTTEFVAVVSLADGKLRIWTGGGKRSSPSSTSTGPVQSTEQASTNPAQAWSNWQAPFLPRLAPGPLVIAGAAILLVDGSVQLWVVTSDGTLHSTWTSTTNPVIWGPWVTPFLPNPGLVMDVAVAHLKGGTVQLFVMTRAAADGSVQILTSRQTTTQPNVNPPGWSPWMSLGTVPV